MSDTPSHQRPSDHQPPSAARRPHPIVAHGHERIDEYYWLRDRENPEVIDYLKAENAYHEAMTAHTAELRDALYDEMVGRIREDDMSAPTKIDDYLYYHRTVKGKQYRIYCRKRGGLEATEEILIDLNELSEGESYLNLGVFKVSPDHSLLAYSLDTAGSEKYTVYVKDLKSGELLPDRIPETDYALEWAADNGTFFYSVTDAAQRPHKVKRHVLGNPTEEDAEVYHEENEQFRVGLYKTKDEAFIVIDTHSVETSEERLIATSSPEDDPILVQERRRDVRYSVDHRDDILFIHTNDEAKNYRVMVAPVSNPGRENWTELIPHDPAVYIEGLQLFADYLAIFQRSNGVQEIRVRRFADGEFFSVPFPEPIYSIWVGANPEFYSTKLRFIYMSLKTPISVIDFDMETRGWTEVKRDPVLGGYNPDDYVSERIFAVADDGVRIPISIVRPKDSAMDGSNPCLLYGYGSYGANMDPWFSSSRVSLLQRGFVFALAHIRGGQEMGREWYDSGKFLNKRNTFTDFIACARTLIAEGYTNPERLAIMGGSAGGMLIGAVVNLAPELFKAAVAQVPFVDVVTTMLDSSLPLTVNEYEEWGNPNEEEFYRYMLSYSPYDNVRAGEYPHMLITAGLNDPRVQYWEPAKWAAKLRAMKTDGNKLLLRTNMGAGHGGASGRYDALKELALDYAFILDALGIEE